MVDTNILLEIKPIVIIPIKFKDSANPPISPKSVRIE